MNEESLGIIIFALIALGAVFAFIFVLGGPEQTGAVAGNNKLATSWFRVDDAFRACDRGSMCSDGLAALPTGNYDEITELYECKCQTSDHSFTFYRSKYAPG